MCELSIKVIVDIVVDSCVQIITDNAPVCKTASRIVEAKYPQVFWTPCIAHSLNLDLKILLLACLGLEVLLRMQVISTTLYKIILMPSQSTRSTPIYHSWRLQIRGLPLHSIMLKRLREVKTALGAMVILEFGIFGERRIKHPKKESRTQC